MFYKKRNHVGENENKRRDMCYKKRERNVGRTRKKRMREMYYKKEKRTLGNRVTEKEKYM